MTWHISGIKKLWVGDVRRSGCRSNIEVSETGNETTAQAAVPKSGTTSHHGSDLRGFHASRREFVSGYNLPPRHGYLRSTRFAYFSYTFSSKRS